MHPMQAATCPRGTPEWGRLSCHVHVSWGGGGGGGGYTMGAFWKRVGRLAALRSGTSPPAASLSCSVAAALSLTVGMSAAHAHWTSG